MLKAYTCQIKGILTEGNVIQSGADITGRINMYLRIFLAKGDVALVELVIMFNIVIILPTIGKMPVGSGEVRSLNQSRPSVVKAGLSL
jgi:hypothetical protein